MGTDVLADGGAGTGIRSRGLGFAQAGQRQCADRSKTAGGKTAALIMDPAEPYWATCDARIAAAGLTNAQIEVVWLKEADANPSSVWPAYAQTLRDEMGVILQNLKARYPSTRSSHRFKSPISSMHTECGIGYSCHSTG